jgi:APA family basic amino acid/polyamine antiporter
VESRVTLVITGLPPRTWIAYIVWLILGLVVYFTYSRSRSKLAKSNA